VIGAGQRQSRVKNPEVDKIVKRASKTTFLEVLFF
jgi:hypothetical protein